MYNFEKKIKVILKLTAGTCLKKGVIGKSLPQCSILYF